METTRARRVAFVEASLSGTAFRAMECAFDLGCQVLFLTRDIEYYSVHGGLSRPTIAEKAEVVECETNDVDTVAQVLGGRDVCAVLSAGEHHIAVAAAAAARLGARGLSPEAGWAARNKRIAAMRYASWGIKIPRTFAVQSPAESAEAAAKLGLPVVVKPVDGTASVGVKFCRSVAEVSEHVAALLGRGRNRRGQAQQREALVTEFVAGAEVSVETLTSAGVTEVLGITMKRLGELPYFVEVGHVFPALLPAPEARACALMARAAIRALGIDRGAGHVEMRVTSDGPVLLEVNARPGGDQIMTLVRLATGVDPLQEWVRVHLDDDPPRRWPNAERAAAIRYLTPSAGAIKTIGGVDAFSRLPWLANHAIHVRPGDVVRPLRASHDRCGYVIATAAHPTTALQRADLAHDLVRIDVAASVEAKA